MKRTKEIMKKLICAGLSACVILPAAGITSFAADSDYWRYTVTYGDDKWKTAAETDDSRVHIDYTNIISGLNTAKQYFDVTNETVGSVSDDVSKHTVVFEKKLANTDTAPNVTNGTISISDKSISNTDGIVRYNFDFKPLNHIDNWNVRTLKVRFNPGGSTNPLYHYSLLVDCLGNTNNGDSQVTLAVGNFDNGAGQGYNDDITSGKNGGWHSLNKWYRYYVEAETASNKITVGIKCLDDDSTVVEKVITDVAEGGMPTANASILATVQSDAVSFEFKESDKIKYTLTETGEPLFTQKTNTSCTDSYLKLTAKDAYSSATGDSSNYLTVTSGGKSLCYTSGVYDYSMLFKVNKRTDNGISNTLLMTARMGNDVTWGYALKVFGLSDGQSKNAINIGLGDLFRDSDVKSGYNNWTTADAWYKYHININYYTNTVTVGVTNMSTGEEVFTPYVTTFDPVKYPALSTAVTTSIHRYGADYAIDDVTDSRDIFIYKDAAITADDTNVTAKVQFANDVLAGAYNPPYNGTGHEPMLILATYDKDGRLINVNSVKPTINNTRKANEAVTWNEVTVSVNKEDNYSYARAYLWKSLTDGIIPFCNEVFTTVQE